MSYTSRSVLFLLTFILMGQLPIQECLFGQVPAENVILITLDGLRPEEMFGGADERLFLEDLGVKDAEAYQAEYGGDSAQERRKKLLPFLWQRIEANEAWIAGDLEQDSHVRVTNGRYFSYPGYNELLCGFADEAIDSNAKRNNKNRTVLECLNRQPAFAGQVQAFCSWDVFPFIINSERSGIPVNAGWQPLEIGDAAQIAMLNNMAGNIVREWEGVRYDVFTALGAMQAMQTQHPRVLYVSLGETDDWAHAGRYDRYLFSARHNDRLIQQIWETSQALDAYRGKTAFVLSTDHGRGDGREGWKSHGANLPGSERIWVMAFGSGIARSGIEAGGEYTQSQIAATVAALVGTDLVAEDSRVAPALPILSEEESN